MLIEICKKAHETKCETLVQDLYQELNKLQEITNNIIRGNLKDSEKSEW